MLSVPISAQTRSIENVKNKRIYFITSNNVYGMGTYLEMTPPPLAGINEYLTELKLSDVEILTPRGRHAGNEPSIRLTFPGDKIFINRLPLQSSPIFMEQSRQALGSPRSESFWPPHIEEGGKRRKTRKTRKTRKRRKTKKTKKSLRRK
jgi:hypothetical protein